MKKLCWTRKQKVASLLIFIAILGMACIFIVEQHRKKAEDAVTYKDTAIKVGTISQTLTATGEIKGEEGEKIIFSKSKTFKAMCVEAKEYVPAGEPIAIYTDGSAMKEDCGGVVFKINAPRTGQKGDGSQCVIFLPTDKVHLEINVPEEDINRIPFDGNADVVFHGQSVKTFPGKVSYIGAESNASQHSENQCNGSDAGDADDIGEDDSRNADGSGEDNSSTGAGAVYTITITLDNDGSLLPGMSADCTLLLAKKENILMVPVESVLFDESGRYVNVVTSHGDVRKTPVETGISDAHNVEILSGLEGSETVRYPVNGTEGGAK